MTTEKIPARNFCNDLRVKTILFFKTDGSVQEFGCYNQGEHCYEESIALDNVAFIVRLMLDGSIDYPYTSAAVTSRRSITRIEVTIENVKSQQAMISSTFDIVDPALCANMAPNTHRDESASCQICWISYGTGSPVCVRICNTVTLE